MSRRTAAHAALLSLALAACTGARALAPPLRAHAPPMPVVLVQGDIGAAGAAAAAARATGGKVLGVSASRAGDRTVYRVRVLLPGGRVRSVTVDGDTGAVR